MDLTLEIDTNNQQEIQFIRIQDTTKVLTSKQYSKLLSASSNPKAIVLETKISFTMVSTQSSSEEMCCLLAHIVKDYWQTGSGHETGPNMAYWVSRSDVLD